MESFFKSLWYKPELKPLACLFLPFSALYWLINRIINWQRKKQRREFNIPVIVIGNLTTGGTGKTPVLITLTRFLQEQDLKVGIISRGYKSHAEHAVNATLITQAHRAEDVGDEPLLIFNKTGAPVAVNANRTLAVQTLLRAYPDLDLILSDDGLQNARLHRDMELIIIDGGRGFGNRFLIPAGPLREPVKRLQQADFCIINGTASQALHNLEAYLPADFTCFQFIPKGFLPLAADTPPLPKTKVVHAIAGIGNPARFFQTLKELHIRFIPYVFPDHYAFKTSDFSGLENETIIMTEKDAVKCQNFNLNKAYALEMEGRFDSKFLNDFLSRIRYTIAQKKSKLKGSL